jgi:hypothetical protein
MVDIGLTMHLAKKADLTLVFLTLCLGEGTRLWFPSLFLAMHFVRALLRKRKPMRTTFVIGLADILTSF